MSLEGSGNVRAHRLTNSLLLFESLVFQFFDLEPLLEIQAFIFLLWNLRILLMMCRAAVSFVNELACVTLALWEVQDSREVLGGSMSLRTTPKLQVWHGGGLQTLCSGHPLTSVTFIIEIFLKKIHTYNIFIIFFISSCPVTKLRSVCISWGLLSSSGG